MITVNYSNQKPLWEFLENTPNTNAPSKDIGISSAASIINSQSNTTPVVVGISQDKQTIVIQPSVVQTPNGPTVVNPTVVLAPAIVSNLDGEKIVVKPDVSTIHIDHEMVAAAPMASAAAAPAAAMSSAAQAVVVPSPAPTPAPVASKMALPEPAAVPVQEGCYPLRHYDMSKVEPSTWSGKDSAESYQTWSA